MNLPNEPGMLLSFINMRLRDNYSSLDDMCDDLDFDYQELLIKLEALGIRYDKENNQLKEK